MTIRVVIHYQTDHRSFFTGLREFQPTMLLLVRTYEPVLLPVYNRPFGLSRLHLVLRE